MQMNNLIPVCWTLGWDLEPQLGFKDGTYMPRRAALLLYPEYFDREGNPILSMLPMKREWEEKQTKPLRGQKDNRTFGARLRRLIIKFKKRKGKQYEENIAE